MSCGIAIFVKTPSRSPVKSRLWPGIGRRRAEALYLLSAEAVASVAIRAGLNSESMHPYWAVAEPEAQLDPVWTDLPHLEQGSGGLGERMAQVYAQLRQTHRGAILIGADTPQLTVALLRRAAEWLQGADSRLVLGRAEDGGFWLFGGNATVMPDAWTRVAYSAADTAQQFVRSMQGSSQWLELEPLRDIDEERDIGPVLAALAALQAPTPAQERLTRWLAEMPVPTETRT
jgi:rSAM/selenodomain-associated transferase 1